MKKFLINIFPLVLIMFLPLSAICKTISLGSGEYPPFTSEKLKDARIADDVLEQAFLSVGIKVNMKYYPWKRTYALAVHGKELAGTHPWQKTPEREKECYFSDAIYEDNVVFFHLKDVAFDWNKLEDLKKYNVGGTRGYHYMDKFEKLGIKIDVVSSDKLNYRKLLKKRIDVFPNSMIVGYYQINQNYDRSKAALFTNHKKPMSKGAPFYFLVSKKRADGKELIDLFNKGLKNIKKSGVYDQIMDKVK